MQRPAVTDEDVGEDADVSGPIGNLHVSGGTTKPNLQAPSQQAGAEQVGLSSAAGLG